MQTQPGEDSVCCLMDTSGFALPPGWAAESSVRNRLRKMLGDSNEDNGIPDPHKQVVSLPPIFRPKGRTYHSSQTSCLLPQSWQSLPHWKPGAIAYRKQFGRLEVLREHLGVVFCLLVGDTHLIAKDTVREGVKVGRIGAEIGEAIPQPSFSCRQFGSGKAK